MSSRLADKAKLVAEGQKSLAASTEAVLDGMLKQQADSKNRMADATAKLAAVQADIDAGTSTIEDVVNQLTNQ